MKKQLTILGLFLFFSIGLNAQVNPSETVDTPKKENVAQPTPVVSNPGQPTTPQQAKPNSEPGKADTPKGMADADSYYIKWGFLILSFALMLYLFYKFFKHLEAHKQRIGYQSIKLIGLILIFPGVCVLAVIGNGLLNSEVLAALLGTIAGYVLSRDDDSKTAPAPTPDAKRKNRKKK
ncbi:MAG: hypothetical protein IPN76_01410 [Saprospiraceae bacterium]|nr:hypothetical protein [Saprospiraceae bacterium]